MPSAMPAPRKTPNIAICGTPGTGKSTLAAALAAALPSFRVLAVGTEAEARGCRLSYDDSLQTWEIDEEKLVQSLTPTLREGGYIVDWIHADFLASEADREDFEGEEEQETEGDGEELVDLVIQMRAGTEALFDRLRARGYAEEKMQENLDCEIMDEVGAENREVFDEGKCVVLRGEEAETDENVARVKQWVETWSSGR